MRVRNDALSAALFRSPTMHWASTLHMVREQIKAATICHYAGIRIVDDEAWSKAMRTLRQLPAGGRHVAQEYRRMWQHIAKAIDFKQGESK